MEAKRGAQRDRGNVTEWRYTGPRGRVKHAVGHGDVSRRAECGLEVYNSSYWFGTGSQDEYDKLESLPECKRCLRELEI